MNLAVCLLQWSMKQRGEVGGSHSGTVNMELEAESRAVIMLMTSLEREPVTSWEKQELLKVHLKSLPLYRFEGL